MFGWRLRQINKHRVNLHATLILNEGFLPFVMMSSDFAATLSEMHLTCPSFEFPTWTEFALSHTCTPTSLHSNELLEAKAKSERGESWEEEGGLRWPDQHRAVNHQHICSRCRAFEIFPLQWWSFLIIIFYMFNISDTQCHAYLTNEAYHILIRMF